MNPGLRYEDILIETPAVKEVIAFERMLPLLLRAIAF